MRAAFAEIVDYAGLFPPASCGMDEAVLQYDRYRRSTDRWMLGRFVVAATRLQELAVSLEQQAIPVNPADPWQLAVVMGAVLPEELGYIAAFQAAWEPRGVLANTVEYKVANVGQVRVVGEQIPHVFRRFLEVPFTAPYSEIVSEIGKCGAFAKIRTGGTSVESFPTAEDLTLFLIAAVKHRVPFKATAGLHHPVRGEYPLTYKPDAERGWMYGFVNLLLATTEVMRGGDPELAQMILEEHDKSTIRRDGDALRWRAEKYPSHDLIAAHQQFFTGFGSCSFREPVDELGFGING
jgi:hypothetical protein